jgi:glycine cleavage system aminomethyltransferase T
MMDGVIIRTADDEFITYWLQPYIAYALQKGSYDAPGEDITGRVFLFQVAGPRSLEALERASGDDLHDIKFMHHRTSRISGIEVRILRMGMAGTLAYEVHGAIEGAQDVYRAIFSAGKEYGMRKLGQVAYMMNHTEDGFPQAYYHFPYPWYEDPGFAEYLDTQGGNRFGTNAEFRGSVGPDPTLHYRNPVELGWAGMVKFDHDFVGRKALETMVANPKRRMVTLEWSIEDVVDIYASQFRDEEPYPPMDRPNDVYYESARAHVYHADQVLKDGKLVGISSGRSISQFYRKMLSLCSIDIEFSTIGTDLTVLWGDPGTRQKQVRAKVARFPYLNENRNQDVDVSVIPGAAKR